MEHGQIVKFYKDYDNDPYIAIKYRDHYLFVSTSTFNRRDDFIESVTEKYKDTGINILDIPILDIIKQYVEEYSPSIKEIKSYYYGMIVRHKITHKYFISVAARFNSDTINCFLVDLETFKITEIPMDNWNEQTAYLNTNYDYIMDFSSLQLKIK